MTRDSDGVKRRTGGASRLRGHGPAGVFDAWVGVVRSPRSFFDRAITPGDQRPGLVFAIAVGVVYVAGTLRFAPETVLGPDRVPVIGSSPLLTGLLLVLLTAVFFVPVLLHLLAAVQTVLLAVAVDDRAGVSETVQVLAYATAPCAIAWIPFAPAQLLLAGYGAVLLAIGISSVHGTSIPAGFGLSFIPSIVVFGWLFGGVSAGRETIALVLALS